ncbi:hypothetical protein DVK85_12805 [Flavobacterium arcticum]|uniref:Uncharacterized protein n=1 Tax=Flavobacterium arcticum TaxID=1784713 RepID=A0A345HEQ1_9FLAO|nr:hypothetical protein [Flavobacterium arcticum]AXG75061.1 hypothetical protein DVK85_12805 [Flavobacterium arcticum]
MFTTGQWSFAAFFIIIFVTAMIYVYRKDLKLHKKYYKGNYKVLLVFLGFIALLFFIKIYLKE